MDEWRDIAEGEEIAALSLVVAAIEKETAVESAALEALSLVVAAIEKEIPVESVVLDERDEDKNEAKK